MCQKSVYALQGGFKLSFGSVEPVDVDSRVTPRNGGCKKQKKLTKRYENKGRRKSSWE